MSILKKKGTLFSYEGIKNIYGKEKTDFLLSNLEVRESDSNNHVVEFYLKTDLEGQLSPVVIKDGSLITDIKKEVKLFDEKVLIQDTSDVLKSYLYLVKSKNAPIYEVLFDVLVTIGDSIKMTEEEFSEEFVLLEDLSQLIQREYDSSKSLEGLSVDKLQLTINKEKVIIVNGEIHVEEKDRSINGVYPFAKEVRNIGGVDIDVQAIHLSHIIKIINQIEVAVEKVKRYKNNFNSRYDIIDVKRYIERARKSMPSKNLHKVPFYDENGKFVESQNEK